jgi:hypothetical protein
MKKQFFKIFIIHFFIILCLIILKEKVIGIGYKFYVGNANPLSWEEVFNGLFTNIILSFILSVIISHILIHAIDEYKKQQIIDLEAARKRLEERDKNNDQSKIDKLNEESNS